MKTLLFTLLCCASLVAQQKQREVRYYLLDMQSRDYKTIITELEKSFKEVLPKNNLSVVTNKLGTLALIKMDWGSKPVQWGKATPQKDPKADVLDAIKVLEVDTGEHFRVVEELQKPEWDNTRETAEEPK